MNVGDLATLICSDVGQSNSAAISFATSQIQRKYEILYNGHNWQEAIDSAVIIPPYPGPGNPIQDVYLPYFIDRVINVKFSIDGGTSYRNLRMRERDWIDKFDWSTFTPLAIGNQPRYYYVGRPVGFPFVPVTNLPLKLTPVGTTALVIQVLIEGVDSNGGYLSESFSITGSGSVNATLTSYAQIVNICVSTNADIPITIANQTGTQTVNTQVGGGNLRYVHIVLWPGYDGVQQIKVLHKLKIDVIKNTLSIPRVSALTDPLYYFVRGAMYGRAKQKDLEAADIVIANTLFEAAKKIELEQAGMVQQIVPYIYDDPSQLFDDSDVW